MATARIAVTTGEPAGIGPDIVLAAARQPREAELVAIADPSLLARRAHSLGLDITIEITSLDAAPEQHRPGRLRVLPVELAVPGTAGELDPRNAAYVLETLRTAANGCLNGQFAAMVTAPVQKSVINDAGFAFSGHTEFLEELSATPRVVMMLATPEMRVALATTHLPLARVPGAITRDGLTSTLEVLEHDLRARFGIREPRIAVLGLNPHAGEGGHLGREEIETITPVVQSLRARGMRLTDPLPADTAFKPDLLERCDAVLAMYHDQGLPVLKYAGFGRAVNITLGLPFLRVSVDHGTALDLAGTGRADSGSLAAALAMASDLASNT